MDGAELKQAAEAAAAAGAERTFHVCLFSSFIFLFMCILLFAPSKLTAAVELNREHGEYFPLFCFFQQSEFFAQQDTLSEAHSESLSHATGAFLFFAARSWG